MKKFCFVLLGAASLFAGKADDAQMQGANEGKYTFIFVSKQETPHVKRMQEIFEETMQKHAPRAVGVKIDWNDPQEKDFLAKNNLSRAPMPFVLVLAPNGAIMGGFPSSFSEESLTSAFSTPAVEKSLKALQEHKLVFLCVQNSQTKNNTTAMEGVNAFKSDPNYGSATEIVMLDPEKEGAFLEKLNVTLKGEDATTVFIAPPAEVIGTFTGATTKAELAKTLNQAVSGCCPGGCCPGGCCPGGCCK